MHYLLKNLDPTYRKFFSLGNLSFPMKPVIIVSTFPNKIITKRIANQLVKQKLVACVNMTKIDSVYSWKGKTQNDSEYLVFFKTTKKNEKTLKNELKKLHPYDVPEIVEINVNSMNKPYLDWLIDSTL